MDDYKMVDYNSWKNINEDSASSQTWRDFNSWKVSLDTIFDRKKTLRDHRDGQIFKLPSTTQIFKESIWEIDSFMELKAKLNSEKDRLDNFDLRTWHKHTFSTNTAKRILRTVRGRCGGEFCTKAWGKIMELMSTPNVIPQSILEAFTAGEHGVSFNSVHLCEGPGAFIAGIHHYITTQHKGLEWNWMGTTLNPYHEQNDILSVIEDDTLIKAGHKNWTFLSDNTGNILNQRNIKGLVQKVGKVFGPVHLVTADGSVDCQVVPGEQEIKIVGILIAEIIAALNILSEGGTLFIKIFTFFECQTICCLYLLTCVFSEVKLVKPVTSKEGNSEIYVVCSGYSGLSAHMKAYLTFTPVFEKNLKTLALFSVAAIPRAFIEKVKDAAHFFADAQIRVISRNISSFGDHQRLYQRIHRHQVELPFKWITRFNVKRLNREDRLFRAPPLPPTVMGSYMTSDAYESLTFKNLGETVKNRMADFTSMRMEKSGFSIEETYKIERVTIGKQYKNILCSAFCKGRLLFVRQQLRDLFIEKGAPALLINQIQHCTDSENKLKLKKADGEFRVGEKLALGTLCYHETIEGLTQTTDADATISGLKLLVATMETLEKDASLFLCEYPLLTRLHVGFIFALTACFERIQIGFNTEENIQGVLLFGFKGFDGHPSLLEDLGIIVTALEEKIPNEAVLECIPVQVLRTNKYAKGIMDYNMANLMRGLQAMADQADTDVNSV